MNWLKFISKFNLNSRPSLVIISSFFTIIMIGTYLLTLPFSTHSGKQLSLIDAYFTANSATCVTGLVVVDTGTTFSFWGKLIILALIQIGGLGYMTLSSLVAIMFRRKILITQRMALRDALNLFSSQGIVRIIKNMFLTVIVVEAVGAFILFIRWLPSLGWRQAVSHGIFHSISAFCNAGFDITGNFRSLMPYVADPIVNIVIMSLIVVGGIGFFVIHDMLDFKKRSLHTKIVIATTLILIIFGAFMISALEWNNKETLGNLSLQGKGFASIFQSVTPRTAGFNTIDISRMLPSTLLLIIIFMFIGASPGGTGGGIKTTTFALLLMTAKSSILGRTSTEAFEKRIPNETVRKAITIILLGTTVVIASTMLISLTQSFNLLDILFEVTSAFGTVGLSTGITTQLSNLNKVVIALTMFIGRIGPITFFLAITLFRGERKVKYLKEDVSIG